MRTKEQVERHRNNRRSECMQRIDELLESGHTTEYVKLLLLQQIIIALDDVSYSIDDISPNQ